MKPVSTSEGPLDVARPTPTQTFDLRGQPPDLLVELIARACARAEPGAVIAMIVDDPGFADRIQRWLADATATLMVLERRGAITELLIRIDPLIRSRALPKPAPRVTPERERCALLILRDDHEALAAALIIANGAASEGLDTNLFFSFRGLNLLRAARAESAPGGIVQRLVKWVTRRRAAVESVPELMHGAAQLGVRFTACLTSMSAMGIAPRDLHAYPNLDFGGLAGFVEEARHAAISMVF